MSGLLFECVLPGNLVANTAHFDDRADHDALFTNRACSVGDRVEATILVDEDFLALFSIVLRESPVDGALRDGIRPSVRTRVVDDLVQGPAFGLGERIAR